MSIDFNLTKKAVIINGEQDTFVQFLYPSNGINWLQGDFGDSGLPDIRAQAGFVAEDGRFFALPGSGTENVSEIRFIKMNSHVGGIECFNYVYYVF